MHSLTSTLVACALVASFAVGCGGDGDGYCDTVVETQTEFADFSRGDFSTLSSFRDRLHELADTGPTEVQDDWELLASKFDSFLSALDEIGLEPTQLEDPESIELPEGVDPDAFAVAMTQAKGLRGPAFDAAVERIADHARTECNITFDNS